MSPSPSFALHLAEVAQSEGYDPRAFGLKTMFFSGEPGASVPGVRDRIESAFGAQVIDCGSMAEMTPFMNVSGTAETSGMLCWQDIIYTEVCDPKTFHRVPYSVAQARGNIQDRMLDRISISSSNELIAVRLAACQRPQPPRSAVRKHNSSWPTPCDPRLLAWHGACDSRIAPASGRR